LYLAKVDLISG